jgi:LemA protein
MDSVMIIGIICGVLFLFVMIWFFSTWNRLVSLEENVNQSWANIDVLLKQRYDMLPNLEQIVKGYAKHENELFMEFAKARQAAAGALQNKDVKGVSSAESMMSGMMPRINAVAEAYPELKANVNFLNLQKELVSIENQVADRREMYNQTTTSFNKQIQMIPVNFVAGMKNCLRRDLFEVHGVERETVKLSFS